MDKFRKMPPLPNKRNANPPRPTMEIVSNKISIPARYNSIERVLRETKRELSYEGEHRTNETSENNERKNVFFRRPSSANQQNSNQRIGLSKVSIRSRQSKGSVGSKDSRGSVERPKNRQSPHYSRKMRLSMPSISAHSWVLYEMKQQKFICGRANFKRREIASLTKIMNLITMLQLLNSHTLVANRIRILISQQACTMNGTTAELRPDMEMSLEDLFYGMMLPSGNDAAHQIAQIGGTIIDLAREGQIQKNTIYNCEKLTRAISQNGNAVAIYNNQMNQIARKICLNRSTWANPHGLSNVNNLSTAEDVAKLCLYSMKNSQFRQIISTKEYNCQYYMEQVNDKGDKQIVKRWIKWQNTNKMLWEGWSGIKTGITPNAGPCLAASYPIILKGRAYEFLIILLNSETMEARWKEAKSLISWISEDSSYT